MIEAVVGIVVEVVSAVVAALDDGVVAEDDEVVDEGVAMFAGSVVVAVEEDSVEVVSIV